MVIEMHELLQKIIECTRYAFITTNHATFTIFPAKIRVLSNLLTKIRSFVGQIWKKGYDIWTDARHIYAEYLWYDEIEN